MTDTAPDLAKAAFMAGPTGLGISASRLADDIRRAVRGAAVAAPPAVDSQVAAEPQPFNDPAYAWTSWGDGTAPPLYTALPERNDMALAEAVDDRLALWAADVGFDEEEIAKMRKAGFGRLVMLGHPDCDDPDQLLIGAQLNAAWWAADDYYADDSALGAVPELLPPRLLLAMTAMDEPPPAGEFTPPLDQAIADERVLVALRSATAYLARRATPAQVQRVCYSTFAMFVSWTAYAAWRHTNQYPPAWKYLAARQHDSFYTSMTLIDVIDRYELTSNFFYDPRVRHAAFQAGTVSVLANDLFSVAKDLEDAQPPCNMVLQIAADRKCSIEEAREITINLHNDLVHDFKRRHEELLPVSSPELQRFMRGLRSWMGGSFEWHNTNPRYKRGAKQP